jgi:hypothetical protein
MKDKENIPSFGQVSNLAGARQTHDKNDLASLAPLATAATRQSHANEFSRAAAISCLVLFEPGHCDVRLDHLGGVMAVSSGDSIYATAPLLCDPWEKKKPFEFRRVIGNIGMPGITMLVPSTNPLIRKVGPENWNVVSFATYDGKRQDNFGGTTLHLSFTGYNPPVTLADHGAQDSEQFILESVVSVHDHGKWVADLDVMQGPGSDRLFRILRLPSGSCQHETSHLPNTGLIAIDSWEEFLDLPHKGTVVRACGNWVARLSVAAIGIRLIAGSKEGRILACGEPFCWKCYGKH